MMMGYETKVCLAFYHLRAREYLTCFVGTRSTLVRNTKLLLYEQAYEPTLEDK